MMNFRKNAAAVIINSSGLILAGKRTDAKDAWQLPQGGVNENEGFETAVFREIHEETGIEKKHLIIVKMSEKVRYEFPGDIKEKMGFDGQEQIYFLIRISQSGWKLRKSNEFCDFKWMTPDEMINCVIDFKKKSYIEAFKQLFGEQE
jgi:putative (di)nucleoside polyphosphate hydrolase